VNRSWSEKKWGKDKIRSSDEAFCADAIRAGFGGSSTRVDAVTFLAGNMRGQRCGFARPCKKSSARGVCLEFRAG